MSVTSTLTRPLPTNQKLREVHHWVNGRLLTGTSGRYGDVYNPASGEVQARVALATPTEVDTAVAAAAAAFPAWSAQPPLRRARVLFRFREIFEQRLDEVAALLTSEHGKVFSDL
jgi:malonate-semialdehyde dehydrogenase (acetylating)/methylmalonate-semialdehyde dehydrogenase